MHAHVHVQLCTHGAKGRMIIETLGVCFIINSDQNSYPDGHHHYLWLSPLSALALCYRGQAYPVCRVQARGSWRVSRELRGALTNEPTKPEWHRGRSSLSSSAAGPGTHRARSRVPACAAQYVTNESCAPCSCRPTAARPAPYREGKGPAASHCHG